MELVNNRYRIIKNIKQNRLVSSYLVADIKDKYKEIQLNILNSEFLPEALLEYYSKEFIVLSKIKTKNIMRNYNFNIVSFIDNKRVQTDQYYYTCEHLKNEIDIFEITKSMSRKKMLDLFIQICSGVNYLHLKGFIYGEINLNNLLLTKAESGYEIKLRDIATLELEKYISKTERIDEAYFKSPKLLSGEKPTIQSDLYSLGVVLLILLRKKISNQFNALRELQAVKSFVKNGENSGTEEFNFIMNILPVLEKMLSVKGEGYQNLKDIVNDINAIFNQNYSIFKKEEIEKLNFNTKIVGREAEIKRVLKSYDFMIKFKPTKKLFIIHGESGSGKTRFLEEIKYLMQFKKANVYTSFSLSNLKESSNNVWVELLRRLIADADPDTIEKYEPELMEFFPEIVDRKNAAPIDILVGDNIKYRLLNRIAGFVSDCVKDKPSVFIIDNLHMANDFTIDAFTYLHNEVLKSRNIILMFSYKDTESFNNKKFMEYLLKIKEKEEYEDITMKNLSAEQTAFMVQNMLSMPRTPIKFAERIYSQSYGNPLFVSEIIKNLYSNKLIFVNAKSGIWHADYDGEIGLMTFPIPVTMEQAILDQVKDVSPLEKEILKVISVFSNSVSVEDLNQFINLDFMEIENSVEQLVVKGILAKKIGDNSYVYDINNRILKDIVYEGIGYNEKIEKHKLAAAILEAGYDKKLIGNIDELVFHLEKAGINDKVRKFSIESANRMHLLKNRRAEIKYYEKAVSVFYDEDKIDRIELLFKIGDLYFDDSDILKALEYYYAANKLSREMESNRYLVDSYVKIADVYVEKNDQKNVIKYVKKINSILKNFEYKLGSLESKRLEAVVYFKEQKHGIVNELCGEILKYSDEGFDKIKGDAYRLLGNVSNAEDAINYYNNSISFYEKSNRIREMLMSLNNIGVIYGDYYQNYEMALIYFLKTKDLGEENNFSSNEVLALTNIAEIHYTKFNYEASYNYFKQALDKGLKIGAEALVFYCYNALTKISLELNLYQEAYNYYLLSNKELKEYPDQGSYIGEYYRAKAELFYSFGCFKEAEVYIKQAIVHYDNDGSINSLLSITLLEYIKIETGAHGELEDCIQRIISISTKFVMPENRVKVLCTAAFLLYRKGLDEAGKKLVFEANKSMIGPIAEEVSALHLYALGILGEERNKIRVLLNSLDLAKKVKNKCRIYYISTAIGDYYFEQNNYFYSANYYIEACEIAKELIAQIPDEYRLNFVNANNFVKPFKRIQYIKSKYIDYNARSQNEIAVSLEHEISDTNDLSDLLKLELVNDFLTNREFIQSIRRLYMSFLPKGIFNERDIITNLGVDTIKNIELVIKYLAVITLATKGIIAVEDMQNGINVIASINGDSELPSNRFIFEKVKATLEPELIVRNTYNHEADINLLSKDVKASLCIPIIPKRNYEGQEYDGDKFKTGSLNQGVSGYLYLESDRILNNFNSNGLQKCLDFNNFLELLIEKHQLQITASIDKLTGALTRKYLEDTLTEEIEKASAFGNPLSIVMYDLDRFKSVNDRFGHQTGDEVLKKVSKIIKDNLGRNDFLGRYGGEEFVIILPGTEIEDALSVAEELRKKVESQRVLGDKCDVTVSMGIAAYPMHGQWKQELIEKADKALYVAKENGRNRCQVWDTKFSSAIKSTNKLNGIITGNSVQDSRNVLVLVELIQLINKSISKEDKIYNLLGRIIEIIEAQYGMLLIIDQGEIAKVYGRKSLDEEWTNSVSYNRIAVQSVLDNKQGLYMIDWDSVGTHDLITGIPDWYSILVVPIMINDEIKGVIYLSVSTRIKEFGFNEFNFVNIISDLAATII